MAERPALAATNVTFVDLHCHHLPLGIMEVDRQFPVARIETWGRSLFLGDRHLGSVIPELTTMERLEEDTPWAAPMHDYTHAALRGDLKLAAELYYKLEPIRDLHHKWVLDPWKRDALCPVSAIKSWTSHLGLTGGAVRPPLPEFPTYKEAEVFAEMQEIGLVPAPAAASR